MLHKRVISAFEKSYRPMSACAVCTGRHGSKIFAVCEFSACPKDPPFRLRSSYQFFQLVVETKWILWINNWLGVMHHGIVLTICRLLTSLGKENFRKDRWKRRNCWKPAFPLFPTILFLLYQRKIAPFESCCSCGLKVL